MNWDLTDRSLCMISGVSPELEMKFYQQGVTSLEVLRNRCASFFPATRAEKLNRAIRRFQKFRKLEMTDAIVNAFPCGHRVRVVRDRFEKACFLDVETDGYSRITCLSTCLNGEMRSFRDGANLDDFLEVWMRADVLVSFNGKRFDVPLILQTFGLSQVPAHVDLMDEARHYGYVGGLKRIERMIGFMRKESEGMDGEDAVELWRCYKKNGGTAALEKLIAYNQEDVKSLLALYQRILLLSLENKSLIDK